MGCGDNSSYRAKPGFWGLQIYKFILDAGTFTFYIRFKTPEYIRAPRFGSQCRETFSIYHVYIRLDSFGQTGTAKYELTIRCRSDVMLLRRLDPSTILPLTIT